MRIGEEPRAVSAIVLPALVVLALVSAGCTKKETPSAAGSKQTPTSPTPSIADPYAGWWVFSDRDISFKYPRSWIVRNDRATGGYWVTINASDDSGIEITQASPRRWLEVEIGPWGLSHSADSTCREPCQIYDTIRLSIANSTSQLVISGWYAQGAPPEELEVLDDPRAVVGASTYKLGTTVHGRRVRVRADVAYIPSDDISDGPASGGSLRDVRRFEQSLTFRDFVLLLDSLSVK